LADIGADIVNVTNIDDIDTKNH